MGRPHPSDKKGRGCPIFNIAHTQLRCASSITQFLAIRFPAVRQRPTGHSVRRFQVPELQPVAHTLAAGVSSSGRPVPPAPDPQRRLIVAPAPDAPGWLPSKTDHPCTGSPVKAAPPAEFRVWSQPRRDGPRHARGAAIRQKAAARELPEYSQEAPVAAASNPRPAQLSATRIAARQRSVCGFAR